LLARALPDVPIVVCKDRYRGGLVAEQKFSVDVHILDDGFQHLALARDLDIVLIDVTQKLSDDALLPAGRLREPPSALKRAHLIVLTRVDAGDSRPLETQMRKINLQAKLFHCRTRLCRLFEVGSGKAIAPEVFQEKRISAVCGLGNPGAFFADLKRWGFSVAEEETFPDHYVYSGRDINRLVKRAGQAGATALLTTEKDGLNFPPAWEGEVPVVACVIQAELQEEQAFEEALIARLEAVREGNVSVPAT